MAGHSKWANIQHRKGRQDAKRGKLFTKLIREVTIAAKMGGGDPDANPRLRAAIDSAKSQSMPKDTIERAIKRGAGGGEGENVEEIRYEGYGPGGVAIIIDCLTDNVNRTAPEMRLLFEKAGGNLAKPGAVSYGFSSKGLFLIETSKVTEEKLMEIAIEAGAEDVVEADGAWEVTTEPADFLTVKETLEKAGIEPDSAQLTMIPANIVVCNAKIGERVLRLLDAIEENDDVQKVYSNADIPDEVMAG